MIEALRSSAEPPGLEYVTSLLGVHLQPPQLHPGGLPLGTAAPSTAAAPWRFYEASPEHHAYLEEVDLRVGQGVHEGAIRLTLDLRDDAGVTRRDAVSLYGRGVLEEHNPRRLPNGIDLVRHRPGGADVVITADPKTDQVFSITIEWAPQGKP